MSTLAVERNLEDDEVQQKKEKEEESNQDIIHPAASDRGHVSVVAGHYNALEDRGLEVRSNSRIYFMRNFNNWIKSVLINQYLTKIQDKKKYGEPLKVLDIGCGKGGDLMKWRIGRISHLVCADVADERLRFKYKDPSIKFDLVSCQFAFHYCFESLPQADIMLCNIAECLKPKGYFIGTTPDAYEIVKRAIKSGKSSFGNSIHNIAFECPIEPPSSIPLFGAKYNFDLEGVVSCPEFLVHFPTFVRLAEKHGLRLTYSIQADSLVGNQETNYEHGKSYLKELGKPDEKIGTLSKEEWEPCIWRLLLKKFQKFKCPVEGTIVCGPFRRCNLMKKVVLILHVNYELNFD
ncbi:hypothetical protein J437_LFUL000254 [Ladona fulva]|uniref:mRNA cap guanine-N(7) methyltransferase n=1 Tax=Ladona fulva TaxID=123851 RepID=A0A8K0JVF5_LADFU|nr:hypothetical protein J437_LFUL000254 [Ladona fulva]